MNMRLHTKGEVNKILSRYNAEYDLGPDCPVTWREEILANAVLELQSELEQLEAKVSAKVLA
jgi:hypothetical protein